MELAERDLGLLSRCRKVVMLGVVLNLGCLYHCSGRDAPNFSTKILAIAIAIAIKNLVTQNLRERNLTTPYQYYARGKLTCKSNLFGSCKGDLNKDLREGKEQVNVKWQIVNK